MFINIEEYFTELNQRWRLYEKYHSPITELLKIDGIELKNNKIHLKPIKNKPKIACHKGILRSPMFDNIENIKKGYFGNLNGYNHLYTDDVVVPDGSREPDIILRINTNKLNLFYDPETLYPHWTLEFGHSFVIKNGIPVDSIEDFFCDDKEFNKLLF